MKSITVLATLVVLGSCSKIPPNFKTCNKTHTDFHQCVRDAAEHNIHQLIHPYRTLQLPSLRPLEIPAMVIGSGRRAVAAEQHFDNCNVHGLDHVQLRKFDFEFEQKRLVFDGLCPEFTKKCHYKLNGKVLLLPIVGEGDSTINIKNLSISGFFEYEEVIKSGKTHPRFVSGELALDAGHVYLHFENLFNGDHALGDTVNQVLNDNWQEVFDDVKDNYAAVINNIIQSLLNNFWSRVSFEEAFNLE